MGTRHRSPSPKSSFIPPGPLGLRELIDEPLSSSERSTIPSNRFFVYPANLWPHKNHERLIRAFERFAERRREPFGLVLTGHADGEDRAIAAPGSVQVQHLGFVSRRLLAELYRRCTALTYFSMYEGFGIPLLEAFELDAPVLCSDVASLPEVGGEATLFGDPTSVDGMSSLMARIADQPDLRRGLRCRGQARLAAFSWGRSADNLLAALRDVASAPVRHADVLDAVRLSRRRVQAATDSHREQRELLVAQEREIEELQRTVRDRSAWAERMVEVAQARLDVIRRQEDERQRLQAAADERLHLVQEQAQTIGMLEEALRAWTARATALDRDCESHKRATEDRLAVVESQQQGITALQETVIRLRAQVGAPADDADVQSAAGPGAAPADPLVTFLRGTSDLVFSVILPLPDHRGHALESVQSWAHAQSLPADRYETIVVGDGSNPRLERQVRASLRPHDRFLMGPQDDEIALYDLGARAASGRWIVFSEAHCLGDARCLKELLRYLLATGSDGAACRSVSLSENHLSRMEARTFEQVSRLRLGPEHWSKLFLRGSVLSRQVYLDSGGLLPRYRLFAEPELSARLHALGYSLGYAPDAVVSHYNTTTVAELRHSIHEYTAGEAAYRLDYPAGEGNRYFGEPSWWRRRGELDAGRARSVWRSLGSMLADSGEGRRAGYQDWLSLVPAAASRGRSHLWRASWSAWRSAARCWWWQNDEEKLFASYTALWAALAEEGGLRALVREQPAMAPEAWADRRELPIAGLPGEWLTGFHTVETYQGSHFQWSGPLACLKLPVTTDDRALRLVTGGLRPDLTLQAFLNGRRAPVAADPGHLGDVRVEIRPEMLRTDLLQYLVLSCRPLSKSEQAAPDSRELGIPLFAVIRERDDDFR